MDYLFGLVGQATENEIALRWLFLAVVALSAASISLAVMFAVSGAVDPTQKRLHRLFQGKTKKEPAVNGEKLMEVLEPLSQISMPTQEKERSGMRERLKWAGFRSSGALGFFYSVKLLLAVMLPCLVIAYNTLFGDLEKNTLFVVLAGAAAVGNLLPSLYVDRALKKRQKLLRHGFPDALDLLVVCVEAGLGLKSAIARVAEELVSSHPDLAAEFEQVNAELRAGLETEIALQNLANRNGLEDIRGFAALLAQSMRFGTSVGETLRVYANEFREKRMALAQEAAAKLGIKLIFPMVACIFPSFFLVAIGPAVLTMIKVFSS